jgi:hypothetical protein
MALRRKHRNGGGVARRRKLKAETKSGGIQRLAFQQAAAYQYQHRQRKETAKCMYLMAMKGSNRCRK